MICELDGQVGATVQDGGRAADLSQEEGCIWRSPVGQAIIRTEKANQIALTHIAVCPTNPRVKQQKAECVKELQHRRHKEEVTPKPQPLARPTVETEMSPEDYNWFLSKWHR